MENVAKHPYVARSGAAIKPVCSNGFYSVQNLAADLLHKKFGMKCIDI